MAEVDDNEHPSKRRKLMNGASSPIMPHAIDSESPDQGDDLFDKTLRAMNNAEEIGVMGDIMSRELETGEKADDAVDYEDISDDDLADDEDEKDAGRGGQLNDTTVHAADDQALPTLEGSGDDLFGDRGGDEDDLFGDHLSSPREPQDADLSKPLSTEPNGIVSSFDFDNDSTLLNSSSTLQDPTIVTSQGQETGEQSFDDLFGNEEVAVEMDPAMREQMELFAMSKEGRIPPPIENHEELLKTLFPGFEQGKVLKWSKVVPQPSAEYTGRPIPKPPKAVRPTKLSLEIAQDEEKGFKSGAVTNKRPRQEERRRLVPVTENVQDRKTQGQMDDLESDDDDLGPIGGVTWQEMQLLCIDWDDQDPERPLLDSRAGKKRPNPFSNGHGPDELNGKSSKRRQVSGDEEDFGDFMPLYEIKIPSLDDPELATARLAQSVVLDLNDPRLLIDIREPSSIKTEKKLASLHRSEIDSTFSKRLSQRFNISNDDAYDLLKENHQNKVRSNLSNLAVEHSFPAQKLQYPYYRTKLAKVETRSFHRPLFGCKSGVIISFDIPEKIKRKHQKGKSARELFSTTKDLSLGDNSDVLLLEYSEEHPAMLSNFGMNTRMINYYRKKSPDDTFRPKLDLGEASVLLPQDKSPLSIFGHIDSGETVQAINNSMFRAPIFPQQPKPTDFLIVRNSTGVSGTKYYLRNIDNVYTVGQQFPSVEIPGPHSRKVTTAAKNRLKMISFRRARKNKGHRVDVSEVTEHFPDTTDMQNRQKMKEFMVFNKEHRAWEMRPGEPIPDAETLRSYVKPEDVCLLESMQTGYQHLVDAGYAKDEGDVEEAEEKDGDTIEEQLAPWNTSKNFLNATQGKAMLQLHGEGDPSGRGEAFSFIKTSMKGGFKAIGESIEDRLDADRQRELGGHSYNVARQQKSYEESIRRIWNAQKESLSSTIEHSDTEMDIDDAHYFDRPTPRSVAQTPAAFSHRDDDLNSTFSRLSAGSSGNRVLKISRKVRIKGGKTELQEQTVQDPRVIRTYVKRRRAIEIERSRLADLKPTGDAEADRVAKQRLLDELERLNRNKERRLAREKQKGIGDAGSPGSPGAGSPSASVGPKKPQGTQRKCANCGEVGHIKTNKKLCPLLNGTMKQEDAFSSQSAFAMGAPSAI